MQGEEEPGTAPEADGIAGDEAERRASDEPPQPRPPTPTPAPRPLPPTIKKLYLYSTPTHVLVFGRSKDRQQWRVLRIERDDAGRGAGGGGGRGGREGGAPSAATAAPLPPPSPPPSSSATEDPSPSAFFEPNFLSAGVAADADGRPPLRASADKRVYSRADAAALLSSLSARAAADGGELRLLTRADAIVGCLRFSAAWHYLVVVTRKRLEAEFGGRGGGGGGGGEAPKDPNQRQRHKIYSVGATALVPLAEGGVEGAAEEKYRRLLAGVELARGFYFSHSWPLWLTTQRAERAAEAAVLRRTRGGRLPLPAGWTPFSELATARAPWSHRCVWNGHATAALRAAVAGASENENGGDGEGDGENGGGGGGEDEAESSDGAAWALRPLVHGGWSSASLSLPGCPSPAVRVTLAARRSRHAAGTRYRRRGIDAAGRAANDVELEQVVEVVEGPDAPSRRRRWWWPLGPAAALVQVRGSAPVRWSQQPSSSLASSGASARGASEGGGSSSSSASASASSFQPPEIVVRSDRRGGDPLRAATARHFADLERRYGSPVVVLDLLSSCSSSPLAAAASREAPLAAALREAIDTVNAVSGCGCGGGGAFRGAPRVYYESWDFKGAARREAASFASRSQQQQQQQQGAPAAFGTDLLRAAGARGAAATALTGLWVSSDGGGGCEQQRQQRQQQRGVLRTNCLDCLDRTHVAQAGVALFAFQACCLSLGLVAAAADAADGEGESVPPIDLSSSAAAALARIWTTVGNLLARQYGGSDAHQRALAERRGSGSSSAGGAAAAAAASSSSSSSIFSWLSRARAAASAAWNDVTRFYDSTYAGGARQIGLDLWLGTYANGSTSNPNGTRIRASWSSSSSMAPSVHGPHPWERLGGGGGGGGGARRGRRRRSRGGGVVSTAGGGKEQEEEEDGGDDDDEDDEGPGWDELAASRGESSGDDDGEEQEGAGGGGGGGRRGRSSRGPLSLFPMQQRPLRPTRSTTATVPPAPPPPTPPPPAPAAFPPPPGSLLASFDRLRSRNTGCLTAVETVSWQAPSLPEWRTFLDQRAAAAAGAAAAAAEAATAAAFSPSPSPPSTPTRGTSPCPSPSPPAPPSGQQPLSRRSSSFSAAGGSSSSLEVLEGFRWRLGQGLLTSLLQFQAAQPPAARASAAAAATAAAAASAGAALAGAGEEQEDDDDEEGGRAGKKEAAASGIAAASLFDAADLFRSTGDGGEGGGEGCRLFDLGTFEEDEEEGEEEDEEEEGEEAGPATGGEGGLGDDEPLSPVSPSPAAAPLLPQQQLLSPLRRRLSFSGPSLSSAASASLDSWWGGGRGGEGFRAATAAAAEAAAVAPPLGAASLPAPPPPRPSSPPYSPQGQASSGGEEEDDEEEGGLGGGSFDGVAGEVAEGELEDASRRVAAALAAADAEQAERAARDSAAAAAAAAVLSL